jgi:hypothetical protein
MAAFGAGDAAPAATGATVHVVRCEVCRSLDGLVKLARRSALRSQTCPERREFLHE